MTDHVFIQRQNSRANRTKQFLSFSDRDISLAEVHDRISNNLALLASTVSMRATGVARRGTPVDAPEMAAILHEITARIAIVGHLHRLLSTQPAAANVEFGAHLRELCRLFVSTLAGRGHVELVETGPVDCTVSADHFLPLSVIVAEVVTNALKYAHPAGAPGKLMIGCRRELDGSTVIGIADDGVGFPEEFDFASCGGIGSRTIHVLAQQIDAEISFDSHATGLSFELRLPAAVRPS